MQNPDLIDTDKVICWLALLLALVVTATIGYLIWTSQVTQTIPLPRETEPEAVALR